MESPQTETTWFPEGGAEATWTTQSKTTWDEKMTIAILEAHELLLSFWTQSLSPKALSSRHFFSQDRKAAALSRGKDTSQLWEGFQVPVSTSQKFDLPAPSVGRQMAPSGCAGQMQRRKERSKKKMEKGRLVN